MSLAASFLGGAKSRLLPLSIPFRFFMTAAAFHVAMWLALLAGANEATSFRGGLGPGLAAVHLLTLGVLTTTAVGASVQLLPVATRRALAALWPARLAFWLFVPGVAVLIGGMYLAHVAALVVGAILATAGLVAFAVVLGDNLRRASSLAVVAAYGWAALGALAANMALGVLLAFDYRMAVVGDHASVALVHMILGGFGFMGLLALGFSHLLIPMFALSAAPERRAAWLGFALAASAAVLASAGAWVGSVAVMTLAAAAGVAAVAVHLLLMQLALAQGMRKRLGLSFVLIRASWAMLAATPLVGLAALYDYAGANGPTLFGFLLLAWLLTFLLGILQRILPFLASMHAPPSSVSISVARFDSTPALKVHAICHGAALVAIATAIAVDDARITQVGAAAGFIGAMAFAWFAGDVLRRVLRPR